MKSINIITIHNNKRIFDNKILYRFIYALNKSFLMSVNLIFGLGFTSEYVIRIIANRGVSDVNSVYLFSVFNLEDFRKKQSEETINTAYKVLSAAGIKDIKPRYLDISKSFDDIVLQVAEYVRGDNLEFYLIGGMRVINLALFYYAIMASHMGKKVKIFSYTENMDRRYDIPERVPKKLGEGHIEILRFMSREEKASSYTRTEWEIEQISKALEKSLSTISKQIQDLEEENYVICTTKRPKICKLTNLGRIAVELSY